MVLYDCPKISMHQLHKLEISSSKYSLKKLDFRQIERFETIMSSGLHVVELLIIDICRTARSWGLE